MGRAPLVVAGVATVALVALVAVDTSMSIAYSLELWTGEEWREIGAWPMSGEGRAVPFGASDVSANASDDVRFRLLVDNGYPWARNESYRVGQGPGFVTGGSIEAPARAEAETEFTIPASRWLQPGGIYSAPKGEGGVTYADVSVEIGDEVVFANFQIKEVAR